jgi:ABC-type polysaccharide/polyol phosphate export permease
LPGKYVDWPSLSISVGITALVLALGTLYFHKTERTFADII